MYTCDRVLGNAPVRSQSAPPSTVLYTPTPSYEDPSPAYSPVAAYTVFRSLGAMARAPIDIASSRLIVAYHDEPAFVVFHTPPSAAPA